MADCPGRWLAWGPGIPVSAYNVYYVKSRRTSASTSGIDPLRSYASQEGASALVAQAAREAEPFARVTAQPLAGSLSQSRTDPAWPQ